jgi:DNA-binding NarL/FixJ family response regulator
VLLADDHAILLDSLRLLLSVQFDVVGTVTDGHALIAAAVALQPDIIVSDIAMPGLNGLDAVPRLREEAPRTRLVLLTMNEDVDTALEAVGRGAAAYVVKSSAGAELLRALEDVIDGRTYVSPAITDDPPGVFAARAQKPRRPRLTLRQREVLQLLAEGRTMKQAADVLGVATRTIAFHKYTLMEQLGVKTTAELMQHAVTLTLVGQKPRPSG